jgi:hypothetical protein
MNKEKKLYRDNKKSNEFWFDEGFLLYGTTKGFLKKILWMLPYTLCVLFHLEGKSRKERPFIIHQAPYTLRGRVIRRRGDALRPL